MLEGKPEKRGRPAFSLAALSAALLSLLALVLLVLFVRNELGWTAIAVATLSAAGLGVALWMDRARTLEGESRERERVEVERALAESRLYGILEGTSDVIVAWDQEFRCIAANSTWRSEFEQLTGARPEIGMNIVEALSAMPEQQERAASLCRRVLCGEAFTITMETTGDRHFEVSYFPVRDEHGRLIGGGHIARDVTARVRAEEEVRSMNDGLGHLVEERTVQLEALLRSERAAREEALRANRLKDEFLA
ncbi:MAG TPA: PAS domain-containing protein, partial [Candidatus Nanopelagicales bacterium]|nr:PAS domain-containing protein [Candidatus Nanopelagicales bacterium]